VRLDSGDLLKLSRRVRSVLDGGGLEEVGIFASGGLDEYEIERLVKAGAPITGFGVGSKLGGSADAPFLDMAYKLSEFDGRAVLKLSSGKATWPGRKQVWRVSRGAHFAQDVVGLADEPGPYGGELLLVGVMVGGRRLRQESTAHARRRAAAQRDALPDGLRSLPPQAAYPVRMSEELVALRDATTATAAAAHQVARR
jgi:nicotinate phosphoribosyltransferase